MDPHLLPLPLTAVRSAIALALLLLAGSSARGAQGLPGITIAELGDGRVRLEWPGTGDLYQLQEAADLPEGSDGTWADVPDVPVWTVSRYRLELQAGEDARFFRLLRLPQPPPGSAPDPVAVAPALPPNTVPDFGSATAFLYSGADPVQRGVAPGAIDRVRSSLVRGVVRKRGDLPLSGARVAIKDHPEYGFTYTRADGRYDLVVNAAEFTVDFQLAGYWPVHRPVRAGAQNSAVTEEVTLVGIDPVATVVNFGPNAPLQVATSSTNSDAAGPRSATILVPPGTCATMRLPDGSTQDCGGLTLRVTEFTVGADGPKAMPAPLPPTTGYTYCAEFSADEALAAGVSTVSFNQPVPIYVDNFLNLPVGTLVPIGSYDREQAVWVPSANGIVLKVLGVADGRAQVDLHGQGQPEPAAVLESLGITTAELQRLASLYPAGKTVWRAPVPHFSTWDFNAGLRQPNPKKPKRPGDKPKANSCDNCGDDYGSLNFSSQVFREHLPLVGVPFELHYSSARVPDYRVDNTLTIPVAYDPPDSGCTDLAAGLVCMSPPPPQPTGIRVETDIAGSRTEEVLPADARTATVTWDGRDAYGRLLGGTRVANITVAYEFPTMEYLGTCCGPEFFDQFPALFGNFGNLNAFTGHAGNRFGVGAVFQQLVTYPDHRLLGLGGWSPTPLHRFDSVGGILYYGDGRVRRVPTSSGANDVPSAMSSLDLVAAGSDGSVYFLGNDTVYGQRILRRKPGGLYQFVTPVPGTPGLVYISNDGWAAADGLPADRVALNRVYSMTTGPDGSLYVNDGFTIGRLTPAGIWRVVVGEGTVSGFPPDGTLARKTLLPPGGNDRAIAVGPDGSLYFTSNWGVVGGTSYNLIRKVAGDGRIYTVFGMGGALREGEGWWTFLGTSAYHARNGGSGHIGSLAVGSDGTLYVSPGFASRNGGAFKITPDGTMRPFLSSGPLSGAGSYDPADPNPATVKNLLGDEGRLATEIANFVFPAEDLQVGADGAVYFLQGYFVWRVNPDGRLQRLAGRSDQAYYTPPFSPVDRADPLNTSLTSRGRMALTPDGRILLTLSGQPVPLYSFFTPEASRTTISIENHGVVASEDGREVYLFDESGKHLRTLDALTGARIWSFDYDARNLVAAITDAAGRVTRIERDAAGQPTAVFGPYGDRTLLALDAQGFLARVTNPANETAVLASSGGGLLLSITGPRGGTYRVEYDALGQATRVADPIGGGLTSSHVEDGLIGDSGYQVRTFATNSLGDTIARQMVLRSDGDTYANHYAASNFVSGTLSGRNGTQSITDADGTILTVEFGADPRFGKSAEAEVRRVLKLPANPALGLAAVELQSTIARSAKLENPNDPLTVIELATILSQNGRAYTSRYTASNQVLTVTSPEGRSHRSQVDALGRLSRDEEPGGATLEFNYDADGRMSAVAESAAGQIRVARLTYDAGGRPSQVIDPAGRSNSYAYDNAGRLKELILTDASPVRFTQDSEDHITALTPPGRPAHDFAYDPVGLLTRYTPPAVSGDDSVRYEYDSERRLSAVTLPDQQRITYSRGPGGRLERLALGAGPTLTLTYGHEAGGFSSAHLLKQVTSSTGDAVAFDYQGSLPVRQIWSGSITGSVAIRLNADLRVAARSVNGSTIEYAYDRDQLMVRAGPLTLARDPASGALTGSTLGSVADQRGYDPFGRLTNHTATVGGNVLWSSAYQYDVLDRLTNKVEIAGNRQHTLGYSYDSAGRLERVWRDGALVTTYTYDANGNRSSRGAELATYDGQDRLITYQGGSFAWSPNGTLKSRTTGANTTTYTYDVRGALVSVAAPGGKVVEYVLDTAGNRIGKKVNGVLQRGWLWEGPAPAAELDSHSAVTTEFIHAADGAAPSYLVRGAHTYRVLSDERGSVRFVVDVADGSIAQELDYDEFGRVLVDTAPGFQPFGFAGGLYDPDTGLVRFGLRDYSPETGQWTDRDPVLFGGGQFSLYAYVGNDPINAVDPNGTGPLGFLRRNRDAAIDAAFDDRPGNNERFAAALDRYDRSVQVAVLTGQVLVNTGQLLIAVIPGQGPRGSFAGSVGRGFGRSAARLASKRGGVQLGGWANRTHFTPSNPVGFSTLARSNPYARTGANTAAQAIRVQPKIRPPVPVEEFDAVAALCSFL